MTVAAKPFELAKAKMSKAARRRDFMVRIPPRRETLEASP
jgi:hypothetical protein